METSAAVVEHYRRAFGQLPVDFAPITDAKEIRGVPEMNQDPVEVHVLVPRYVVAVVDAVAIYKGVDRIEIVQRPEEWVDENEKKPN